MLEKNVVLQRNTVDISFRFEKKHLALFMFLDKAMYKCKDINILFTKE